MNIINGTGIQLMIKDEGMYMYSTCNFHTRTYIVDEILYLDFIHDVSILCVIMQNPEQ